MTDSPSTAANQTPAAPKIAIYHQYVSDLSFENPRVLEINSNDGPPDVELTLDVHINPVNDHEELFIVSLYINAKTLKDQKVLFNLELTYSGLFGVKGFPEADRQIVLAVHCPSLIFPFARRIVATVTQDGGFQPLMIDPVDFGLLYQKKLKEAEKR